MMYSATRDNIQRCYHPVPTCLLVIHGDSSHLMWRHTVAYYIGSPIRERCTLNGIQSSVSLIFIRVRCIENVYVWRRGRIYLTQHIKCTFCGHAKFVAYIVLLVCVSVFVHVRVCVLPVTTHESSAAENALAWTIIMMANIPARH